MNRTSRTMPIVGDVMTLVPRTVLTHQAVTVARRLMKEYGVRHLPVTDDRGKLVGVVSERDTRLLPEKSAPRERRSVQDVMTAKPYAVTSDALVTKVARSMVAKKIGSAVVVDHGDVLGVFTTTDALRVLADAIEGKLARPQVVADVARRPMRPRTRRVGRAALA